VAQFNYQRTVAGLDAPFEEFSIDTAVPLRTSKDNDWSAVRIKGDASKWGELDMKPMTVKVGDHVNIIQHPGGAQKQISFVANVVAFVGGGRVQYLTDTLPGSSGSPVFDTDWNLIALHHSGGWLTEPNAVTKSTYYRNEGIAIDTIIQDLAAKPV
jgi:V8-like Glu-specific endopeptidase